MSNTKLTIPQAIATILAIVHLSLVLCGASYVSPLSDSHVVGKIVHLYSRMSGANSSYGFFAPSVGSQVRARFVMTDYQGDTFHTQLERESREFNIRIHSLMNFFPAIEEGQDLLSRSLSGWMFGQYPDAQKATLIVETYNLPTMMEFRSEVRPVWKEFYTASFLRKPDVEDQ